MVLHWALLIVLFGKATANDCDPCEYGRCDRGGRQHCINFNNNDYPRYHCILPNSTCPPSKKCFEYKNYLLYTENKECLAIDGGWSAWGDYEACSATCGQATKKRVRTCTAPAPENGGAQCDGPSQEIVECGLAECAIDGGWSAWGDYEACSATCGPATKKRVRTCTAPAPENGGAQCDGPSQEIVECGLAECAIDGGWSAWGDYEPCKCNLWTANKTRVRTCTAPAPQNGGAQCDGPSQEIVKCDLAECFNCDPCEYGRCDRGGRQHCLKFKNRGYHCILPSSTCPPSKSCWKYKNYLLYTEKKECPIPAGVDCDCDYSSGGCTISSAPPAGYSCRCSYVGFWTCSGKPIRCVDPSKCPADCSSRKCCGEGGGDCGGY